MIEAGKILQQRYKIDKQIGQGGMGSVYIATDERFGSIVAIKQTLLMDDSYRKAIEREARLLNSLKHTALPRVTDHFLEDNGQFLVMEFIPGDDLGKAVEHDAKPFPVDQVLNWADQLLDALDFLHSQAIPVVHRDIKPQNLKLTPKGQIVLLDFGLAKGNPTDAGHQTAAKSIFGYSRNYASLEQIQGTGTDPRSDLYSLAATLYHLLTGVPPEDALTRAMAVLSGQSDPLVPADRLRSEIPAGVAGILFRAMDLNAAARPATAAEMRSMLREHEKYAAWAEVSAPAATKTQNELSSQPTQLLPGNTQHESPGKTDLKTAIHPGQISEETKVRSTAAQFANTGDDVVVKPKRRSILAAAAAVLLLSGGAFCVYLFSPALFGSQTRDEKTIVTPTPASTEVPGANSAANPGTATGIENEGGQSERPKVLNSTDKGSETSKTTKPPTTGSSKDNNSSEDAVDPDIYVGNVRIRNGRVETPNVTVDENGVVRPTVAPNVPQIPPLTPEQLRQLTPAQRRQIMMIYRNKRRHPIP